MKNLKYVKLFENFSSDYPFSITVKPTEEFKRSLNEMKNADGKPSVLTSNTSFSVIGSIDGDGFRLEMNKMSGIFNLVKIAQTPYAEIKGEVLKGFNGAEDIHWLSYDPKNSEIYVRTSRLFRNSSDYNFEFCSKFKENDELLNRDQRIVNVDANRKDGLIWIGGYHCKFEKGFEVGMKDHRGYFEITKVEPYEN